MNGWWLVVFFAVFFIGVTKSGFGSGVGLMIVPMTAIAMKQIPERGAEAALGLLLPLLVAGDFISVWQYRGVLFEGAEGAQAKGILKKILPGTFVGLVLGSLLLWWFHRQQELVSALMRIEIGFESIILVGIAWWRQYRGIQEQLMSEPGRSFVTGAFAGASSTLAHAAGPIIAMYLLPLRLDRRFFVGLCAIYFGILNAAKMPAYALSGQFARAEIPFTLKFLPLVFAGALFGFWINKRLNDVIFTRIVYLLTFLMGWYILVDGVIVLMGRI